MDWKCPNCDQVQFKVSESGDKISCVNCNLESNATRANEGVSVSPGPNKSLNLDEDLIERQVSFDKSKKKLRGAAMKAKVNKILKERADDGDEGELIDTEELKSESKGAFIKDTNVRSNKARRLKIQIRKAALDLQRCCGYSVRINIEAPVPISGPRGGGVSLDLEDKNGERAPTGCKLMHVKNVTKSVSNQNVNRGTLFLKSVKDNYVNKLTPTKHRLSEQRRHSGENMISPTSTCNLNQSLMSQQSDYDSDEEDTAGSPPEIQFPVIGSQSKPMSQQTDAIQETSPTGNKETSPNPSPPPISLLGKHLQLNPADKQTSTQPTPPTISLLCKTQPLNPTNKRNLLIQISQKTASIPKGFQPVQKPKATIPQTNNNKPRFPTQKPVFPLPSRYPAKITPIGGSKHTVPYSPTFPININGLEPKRQKMDLMNSVTLNKKSEAICGICNQEKKSVTDIGYRPDKKGNLSRPGPVADRWLKCKECSFNVHASCLSNIGKIPLMKTKKDLESFTLMCSHHS